MADLRAEKPEPTRAIGGHGKPMFPLAGCELLITVEDGGYIKAYARPADGSGILSYGLQGRIRDGVAEGVHMLVDQFLEANRG